MRRLCGLAPNCFVGALHRILNLPSFVELVFRRLVVNAWRLGPRTRAALALVAARRRGRCSDLLELLRMAEGYWAVNPLWDDRAWARD